MHNSFKIFKPDNKIFHWDLNNILLILLLLSGFLKILNIEYISKIAEKSILLIFFIGFIMSFANIFRKKTLNGQLLGTLTFNSNNVLINDINVEIKDIQKIFLRVNDYDGLSSLYQRPSLFPTISNGTNNLLDLDLKNGEKIKLFFKMEFMQHEALKPFVISLLKNNSITLEEAIEILKIDDDYLIDKLKIELNKKEL